MNSIEFKNGQVIKFPGHNNGEIYFWVETTGSKCYDRFFNKKEKIMATKVETYLSKVEIEEIRGYNKNPSVENYELRKETIDWVLLTLIKNLDEKREETLKIVEGLDDQSIEKLDKYLKENLRNE